MESVERVLSQLMRDRFYGSVEIKFEAGRPVLLRKTETIKPVEDFSRTNRENPDERTR